MRNTAPQQAAARVTESRPIYYPRRAHTDSEARAGTATDRLLRELLDLHTAMSYEDAAAVADRLVQEMPQRPQVHYNRACVMGRLHRGDEALASLEQAIDCGWRDLVHLSLDPDLASVRGTARFAELRRRVRNLIAIESRAGALSAPEPDGFRRDAPPILHRFDVTSARITLVSTGRVSGTTSITTRTAGGSIPQPEDPIEVSSVVRLLALVALLQPPSSEAMVCVGPVPQRGPLLRLASRGPGPAAAPDGAALIEAVETATGRPFASYCRNQVLGPLRMADTRIADAPGRTGPVILSTPEDLGRLLAALCPPDAGSAAGGQDAAIGRLIAAARRLGLAAPGEPPASAVLELAHRGEQRATLLRWHPRRGRGVVIVTQGGDGIPAARRLASLALGR